MVAEMVRLLGALLGAAVGGFVWLVVAVRMAERGYVEEGGVIDPAVVRAAMAREGVVATRLGMRLAAQGEASIEERGSFGRWSLPLPIGAGECVAVVVGVDGRQGITQLAIQGGVRRDEVSPEAMVAGSTNRGVVGHAQWCERAAIERHVVAASARLVSGSRLPAAATLRWAVYRGSWETVGGPTRLTRGRFRSEALAALGDDLAAQEALPLLPPGARALGPPALLTMGSVRLLPANARTYEALVRISQRHENPQVNPRIDPTTVPGAPWPTGLPLDFASVRLAAGADPTLPVHDPVVDLSRNEFRRVLAVVDRAGLGSPCATIALVRQRFAHEAEVTALEELPEDEAPRGLRIRENVALDARCPAGVTVYLAPADDHDAWTLHTYP